MLGLTSADGGDGTYRVPLLNADVPDVSVVRVPAATRDERDAYYMASTTMHLSPGVPIMKSYDLVNWETVNYVYDRLSVEDAPSLRNGANSYGQSQWAPSLRFHDGRFYVAFNTNNLGGAYIYSTDDIEDGAWERIALGRAFHDLSLFFDDGDNGVPYLLYGSGATHAVRLSDDLTRVVAEYPRVFSAADFPDLPALASGLRYEGTQVFHVDGRYYVVAIAWPARGDRQVVLFRSPRLLGRYATENRHNPYEARCVLDSDGFAQGGLVEVRGEAGNTWHGMFFRDTYPLGRVPALVPASWDDGWPVFGRDGTVRVGDTFPKPVVLPAGEEARERLRSVVVSDDFENTGPHKVFHDHHTSPSSPAHDAEAGSNGSRLDLAWQWNHNPDNRHWSLTAREGWLRLVNGHVVTGRARFTKMPDTGLTYLEEARNTLSQRTFGPRSSAETRLDVSQMGIGDVAGLAVYGRAFAYAGVRRTADTRTLGIVARLAPFERDVDAERVEEFVPGSAHDLGDVTDLLLKADADFATVPGQLWVQFSYCLDGHAWRTIGEPQGPLEMDWSLAHFMGYRFGLFNYATRQPGGWVDFDYYYLSDQLTQVGRPPDQTVLHELVDRARALTLDGLAVETRAALEVALAKAEQVTTPSSQNQVDARSHALATALADLRSR